VTADAKTVPTRCWPVSEWPAPDQAAWVAALQPGDALDPGGLAARWATATRCMIENGYGRWLSWLHNNGLLNPCQTPDKRITVERVAAYVAELTAFTAPFSVQSRVQQLGNALRAMCPQGNWSWVLRGADRIRARAIPARNKRARLQSPDRLVQLGVQIMAEVDASTPGRAMWRAADYRDGLIISLLAHRPIRARNLTMIQCGRHLVQRSGVWWLVFDGSETKTKQPIEISFPVELVPNLECYLATHRPVLLDVGHRHGRALTDALWVSAVGRAMHYASISLQVRRRTEAAFGKALSPHLFRDCAATSIATEDPEHVRIVLQILGHSSLATSERHYNQAQSLEAGRRFQQTIAELRRGVAMNEPVQGRSTKRSSSCAS